jgi:hypothetical protein
MEILSMILSRLLSLLLSLTFKYSPDPSLSPAVLKQHQSLVFFHEKYEDSYDHSQKKLINLYREIKQKIQVDEVDRPCGLAYSAEVWERKNSTFGVLALLDHED